MQIRTKLAVHLAVQIALAALLVLALSLVARTYRAQSGLQAEALELQTLLLELQHGGEAQSLMARLYVQRPEARLADYHAQILGLREGRLPRPPLYGPGFWDSRLAHPELGAFSSGEPEALLVRLRGAGLQASELPGLEAIVQRLEAQLALERRAMGLAELGTAAALREAQAQLHGDDYLRLRAAVAEPVLRLQQQITQRHTEAQADLQRQLRHYTLLAGLPLLLMVAQSLWVARRLDRSVRHPLTVLRDWANAVRAGRMDQRTALKTDNEFGELSVVIDEMTASVERSLAELREEVQRRTRAEEVVQHLANHDALTGLPSLRLLHDRLDRALARAERQQEQLALLFIDLNGFKPVNDRYGHESGDMVLKVVGQRLASALRESDTVGRVGGDEFVAILVDVAGREAAEQVRTKLETLVRQPIYLPAPKVVVQVSAAMGLALYPEMARDAAGLLRLADQAMYARKAEQKRAMGISGRDAPPPPLDLS